MLASRIEDKEGGPAFINACLVEGFAGELERLKNEIRSHQKPDELVALLKALNSKDTPGLFVALQNRYADTIRAYGELLKEVLALFVGR